MYKNVESLKARYGGEFVSIKTVSGDKFDGVVIPFEDEGRLLKTVPESIIRKMIAVYRGDEGRKGKVTLLAAEEIKAIKLRRK